MIELLLSIALSLGFQGEEVDETVRVIDSVVQNESETILDTKEEDEVLLTLWAARESGFHRCIAGDGGKALGILQLHHSSLSIACNRQLATEEWIRRAHASIQTCGDLTVIASGQCGRGKTLVQQRVAFARQLLKRAKK